jgi:hypothetical protein
MGQLYQAIIDAALYVESKKPQSTLSYITNEGEAAFVTVNGTDLRFRDLKVFLTNRPDDTKMFEELRQLAQPLMQNGGSLYDVIELYSTKSMRQMKKVFKELRDRQQAMQEQQLQIQQQQVEQQGQIAQAQLEQAQIQKEQEVANENYQNELDRINKKEIALINAEAKSMGMGLADVDASGTPDVLEISKLATEQDKASKDFQARMADINAKNRLAAEKLSVEREKLQVARENQANDLAIAKENAKGRAKKPKKE